MFRLTQLLRQSVGRAASVRQISGGNQLCSSAQNVGANLHKVNNLEKRFLVWTGKYKALGDVPDMVAYVIYKHIVTYFILSVKSLAIKVYTLFLLF